MDARTHPSIGATVRHARQLTTGWVTLELTAARSVFNMDPADDITEAQALGTALQGAVVEMFEALEPVVAEPRPSPGPPPPPAPPPRPTRPPESPGPAPTRACPVPEHDGATMFRRMRSDGSHFFSHNDESTGGSWCNYQPRGEA